MMNFLSQSIASLFTGFLVGIIFAFFKLPIPAPPVVPAVLGILGITLGYLVFGKFFGN